MKRYDSFVMGHISIDENIYQEKAVKEIGGAVFYSSCASHAIGYKIGVLTKLFPEDRKYLEAFTIPKENITALDSKNTTSIRNIYQKEEPVLLYQLPTPSQSKICLIILILRYIILPVSFRGNSIAE